MLFPYERIPSYIQFLDQTSISWTSLVIQAKRLVYEWGQQDWRWKHSDNGWAALGAPWLARNVHSQAEFLHGDSWYPFRFAHLI